MDAQTESIKVNFDNWKIRIDERSKGRMKLQIKLSKEEAEAYKNFSQICKPNDVSDDQFVKSIFVTGYEALNRELSQLVQKFALENQEELAASGINVIEEDGEVKLTESETVSEEEE